MYVCYVKLLNHLPFFEISQRQKKEDSNETFEISQWKTKYSKGSQRCLKIKTTLRNT